ncbi:MAG TPA: sulfotransferase [Pseudomonadales bacterium]|nr:sulfotransferase [Pseudomonadales bacterium]
MYFDVSYYLRVLTAVWRKSAWPNRYRTLFSLLILTPIFYLFNAICFLLDYLLFPSLWRQQVVSPVFVIGHARSGSTLIHRLLAADAQRFSYFRYWETKCPSLLQKHLVRCLAALDRGWLGGFFNARIKAWDEKTFGPFRHIHDMSLWHSEEDQFVMQSAFVSQQWAMTTPLMDTIDLFHVDHFPEYKRQRWMHHYKECVKRQLLFNGGNKIHLSKNPVMSGWVQSILDTFPDAKIAVVVRNPMECIPSVLKLLEGSWRAKGWHKAAYRPSTQRMIDISLETFTHPAAVLARAENTASIRIDYQQLVKEPAAVVHQVYACFDYDMSPDHAAFLAQLQQRETKHKTHFTYQLSDYPITVARIEEALGDFFDEFAWPMSSQGRLRRAWDIMMKSLNTARDAIDQEAYFPAPATDRNLADGYKYLMGLVHVAIERGFHEERQFPQFRNMLSPITRATIDNADAIYFYAPIDGRRSYRLTTRAGATDHWRGVSIQPGVTKAPHYVIFEATWGDLSGDSGDLKELTPGTRTQTGRLDSSSMCVSEDGTIEIILAPERPEGYEGNFISTLKIAHKPHPFDPAVPAERYATYLTGRQLFSDWAYEEALHFDLEPIEAEALDAGPYSVAQAAEEMIKCGDLAKHQMLFWNAFWTIPMGTYGKRDGSIEGVCFPRNAFNQINAASGATGGGMSTNLYAGGVFELAYDEALIIEMNVPIEPQYIGLQLSNLWGASLDYANHFGSLNGHQMVRDSDGGIRVVIAHKDPGVANWLDTTGLTEGFMAPRWAYSETPDKASWPTINATKVAFEALRSHLPDDIVLTTPAQRLEQLAIRRRHVYRRFRHF